MESQKPSSFNASAILAYNSLILVPSDLQSSMKSYTSSDELNALSPLSFSANLNIIFVSACPSNIEYAFINASSKFLFFSRILFFSQIACLGRKN